MTERMKGNEEIGADMQAFMAAYDRAREELVRIPGVVGVGFGHKNTAGEFTDDVSIQVFVREKKPDVELPPEHRIPKTYAGYRTDVRVIPRVKEALCDDDRKYTTIRGGIQIEPWGSASTRENAKVGTLGCIVRKRGDPSPENVYLLTCDHVLFSNGAVDKDSVYHPTAPATSKPDVEPVLLGPIQYNHVKKIVRVDVPPIPTEDQPFPTDPYIEDEFFVDCAIARLDFPSRCLCITCPDQRFGFDRTIAGLHTPTDPLSPPQPDTVTTNTIAGVRSVARDVSIVLGAGTSAAGAPAAFPRVFKVGRSTEKTRGVVRGVMSPVDPPLGIVGPYPNVIEIEFAPIVTPVNCLGQIAFADHGDSGAIVLDEDDNAIGMVMHIQDVPAGTMKWMTYACHIVPVLESLRVCIPTRGEGPFGTTWGNCAATDGSGIASRPYATAAEQPPDAVFRFTGSAARSAPAPGAEPVTAAQREHIEAVGAAFRASARGRELLDAFDPLRRELGYLVRNDRAVKVAWSRHRGPAFLAHALTHLRGEAATIPRRIDGVARDTLLARMATVLEARGSNALRAAIARHGDTLRAMLADADTIDDCLAWLRALDADEVTA